MKKKSKKQLADEAYLRVEANRVQVGMFDGAPKENPPLADISAGVPPECPSCKKRTARPATWTHMRWRVTEPALQCGSCGKIVGVTEEVWNEVRDDSRVAFYDKPMPKVNTRGPKKRQSDHY